MQVNLVRIQPIYKLSTDYVPLNRVFAIFTDIGPNLKSILVQNTTSFPLNANVSINSITVKNFQKQLVASKFSSTLFVLYIR